MNLDNAGRNIKIQTSDNVTLGNNLKKEEEKKYVLNYFF